MARLTLYGLLCVVFICAVELTRAAYVTTHMIPSYGNYGYGTYLGGYSGGYGGGYGGGFGGIFGSIIYLFVFILIIQMLSGTLGTGLGGNTEKHKSGSSGGHYDDWYY